MALDRVARVYKEKINSYVIEKIPKTIQPN